MIGRPALDLSAYHRALRLLARRDRSEQELRGALLRGGADSDEVETTLEKLRHRGYLDDQRYAERFARTGLAVRGLGRHRLRAELVRRGVSRPRVERGLAEALHEVSEVDVIEGLAQKYWRLHPKDHPERRIQKLWAFLLRRGFPSDLVRARLGQLFPRSRRALEGLEFDDETALRVEPSRTPRVPARSPQERKK